MTQLNISALVLAGTMLAATPALAITVSNQNKGEQTLTVDQGASQTDQKIAAGASSEVECKEGCEVRVRGSGYGRTVRTGDKLVINDEGLLRFADEDLTTGSVGHSDADKTAK